MNRPHPSLKSALKPSRFSTGGGCPCSRPCHEAPTNAVLMQHGESFRFERGDRLWGQDDPADCVVAVCTGAVKSVREWPGDKGMIVDLTFRGGVVGAEAALPGSRRASTAVALTSGRGVRVSLGKLRRLLDGNPAVVRALLTLALDRQQGMALRLDELAQGPVKSRVARVLLRIGDTVGLRDSRGVFIPVPLSRGDLADLVGCRVETVIRIMTKWQRAGVVETQREGLVLKDLEELEADRG